MKMYALARDETREAAPAPAPFVMVSTFVVANGMIEKVKEAFRKRPGRVELSEGFIRMEVLSPLDCPEEIWLMTWWTDRESYRLWHHSHSYRESHEGIPKGLKLVRGQTRIREFEQVCR